MTRLWENEVYNDTSLDHYQSKENGKDQISIHLTQNIVGK